MISASTIRRLWTKLRARINAGAGFTHYTPLWLGNGPVLARGGFVLMLQLRIAYNLVTSASPSHRLRRHPKRPRAIVSRLWAALKGSWGSSGVMDHVIVDNHIA